MKLIDTHTHIYSEEFEGDLEEVLYRAEMAGVDAMILPNIDLESYPRMVALCQSYPGRVYPCLGLHPTSVDGDYETQLRALERELATDQAFVAIGEIGLDYYWDRTFALDQVKAFEYQLKWAQHIGLPVIIHTRSAWQDTLASLLRAAGREVRGVFHSFTGSKDELLQALDFGNMMIGIGGAVTFKNSILREYVSEIPLERLMLETDAPYLSPVPKRGRRNEPAHLVYVLHFLADVYGVSAAELAERTTQNARRLFSLP